MHTSSRRKGRLLALYGVLAALLLSGCATVPPQPITGYVPPTVTQEPVQPIIAQDADAGIPASLPGGEPTADAGALSATRQMASIPPTQVELFYSGTPSMMGFSDASYSTVYEQTMDALPACVSLCWPSASVSYYRYGADIAKDSMRMAKDTLLTYIGNPSFYRDTPLTTQPERLKRDGLPLITTPVNLNEPVLSLYDLLGSEAPTLRTGASGTPVAIAASDAAPSSLSIIVTDLHELRMDDGALLAALNDHPLQSGKAIGMAAIVSEFAGYIPDIGPNSTTFIWGAPPSGTLDYSLDYGEYSVGISVDPEKREMATRPFYVLVMGDQGAVNAYLQALEERLTREFAGNATFKYRSAVFGSGFVPEDYTLAGSMRYVAGQGVTAIPEPAAPAGVSLIELKASQQARFLEWQIDYPVHPADPRGTALTAADFTFIAEAVSGDTRTVLPNLQVSILSATADTVTLGLRLELPQGILPQGSYTLEIGGSLSAPDNLPGSEWLAEYGYDADGTQLFDMEQNTASFDGSRTLYLSRLIDTLGRANLSRLGVAPLGIVQISLTVYA